MVCMIVIRIFDTKTLLLIGNYYALYTYLFTLDSSTLEFKSSWCGVIVEGSLKFVQQKKDEFSKFNNRASSDYTNKPMYTPF